MHSSVNKSIKKAYTNGPGVGVKGSIQGSQHGGSKRGSKVGVSKKEENAAPVPMKIDPPTRQLHTDDLDE